MDWELAGTFKTLDAVLDQRGELGEMLVQLTMPAGALIHIKGIPFWLEADTKVRGRMANMRLVTDDGEAVPLDPK